MPCLNSTLPKVIVGFGIIRLETQCLLKTGRRFLQPALLMPHRSEVIMGLDIVGLQKQGPFTTGSRFIQLALILQGIAQVNEGTGKVRLKESGLARSWPLLPSASPAF